MVDQGERISEVYRLRQTRCTTSIEDVRNERNDQPFIEQIGRCARVLWDCMGTPRIGVSLPVRSATLKYGEGSTEHTAYKALYFGVVGVLNFYRGQELFEL